jgi:hypothetical protein
MAEAYPDLIRELAGARQDLVRQQESAHRWYAEQLAAARTAVRQAQEGANAAGTRVATAQAVIERVDIESFQLWRALGARLGRRDARRLGAPPEPDPTIGYDDADPLVLMRQVRAKLDAVPARRARPLWLPAALALLVVVLIGIAIFLIGVRLS